MEQIFYSPFATHHSLLLRSAFRRPGGFCKVIRPDPIPNSAVKRLSANGTMSQDLGEQVAARPAKGRNNLFSKRPSGRFCFLWRWSIVSALSRGGAAR